MKQIARSRPPALDTRLFTLKFVLALLMSSAACSKPTGWNERELAARVLTEYAVKQQSPKKILVAANPFTQTPGRNPQIYAFEHASIIGIKSGAGERSVTVAYPELQGDAAQNPGATRMDPKTTTPLIFLVQSNSFDRLVAAHPDHDLVISLIGIPPRTTHPEVWKSAVKLAFLFPDWRLLGGPTEIQEAFRSGRVLAAVMNKPRAAEDHQLSSDYQEEFERRFLLVTGQNVEGLLAAYPQLFQ